MAAVSELRALTTVGALGAKEAIYDVIGGAEVRLTPLPGVDPEEVVARLRKCGFVAGVHASDSAEGSGIPPEP